MRCPHCRHSFGDLAQENTASFLLCNRCGRIWVDTGAQRPQGLLETSAANVNPPKAETEVKAV